MGDVPSLLTPDAYAWAIDLDIPFARPNLGEAHDEPSSTVVGWLLEESGAARRVPALESERRRLIKRPLTVRPGRPIPADVQKRIDLKLGEDSDQRGCATVPDVLSASGPSATVAGLSVDAGVDYTDEAAFAEQFPALTKRGLRAA